MSTTSIGGPAQAVREVTAIAAAIARLGGAVTIDQVTAATGLPRALVVRRLQLSGPSNIRHTLRYFARSEAGWGLTERGRRLAGGEDPRT